MSTSFDHRLDKLNNKKDFLIRLNKLIPWEIFREILEDICKKERKSAAGRKSYDLILMFKLLILQQLYNLSDEELEYQVNDRLSFQQFLGLTLEDNVPDATTVWLFREQLKKQGLTELLFDRFNECLEELGYSAKGGQLIDATLIPVPIQRNSREENETIKNGEVPEEWKEDKHKKSQKDTDARWTKKNGKSHFGYKDHINVDKEYEFIRTYEVTNASVHDSKVLGKLLDDKNEGAGIWADSAYASAGIEWVLLILQFIPHINEKGKRNKPLTEEQKEKNKEKSKVRSHVEHVFAHFTQMGGKQVRSIGIERAKTYLGLKNLTYNLKRFVFLAA